MNPPPRTFWNLSNHAIAEAWSAGQVEAARAWEGHSLKLRECAFPVVDPAAEPAEVQALAEVTLRCLRAAGARPSEPVLVMGEFSLVFQLVQMLAAHGLVPVTATTRRKATQQLEADGSVRLLHTFCFVRFRRYEP